MKEKHQVIQICHFLSLRLYFFLLWIYRRVFVSILCWYALLIYHVLSDIINLLLQGITPSLVLSRVSQTQTPDILS